MSPSGGNWRKLGHFGVSIHILAEPSDSNQNRIFMGAVQHSLDDNHRVTVPSRWRYEGLRELFAVPDPRKPFLILMPVEELEKLAKSVETAPDIPPSSRRHFVRQLFSRAQGCTLDRQGRLVLPAEICKALGFDGEVVLAGGGSRIEVWNPDRWETNRGEEESSFAEVANLVGL